jgi:CheY-like chemotaxis protein
MAIQLLLADDSATIAKILVLALQSEDYAIRSAATAEEADKALKSLPPELFLVDLDLPQKNGYQFSKQIKNDSRLTKTRVVLLASAFEPADPLKVQQCAADLVITKPFDPADLRAKLRKLLELPPKFPHGSKVQGSAGGEVVSAPTTTTVTLPNTNLGDLPPPAPTQDRTQATVMLDLSGDVALGQMEEPVLNLSSTTPPAGTLIFDSHQEVPPPFQPMSQDSSSQGPSAMELLLGSNDGPISDSSPDPAALLGELSSSEGPPPFSPIPQASQKIMEAPASSPADELSPNAQALAAFFEAEIHVHSPAEGAQEIHETAAPLEEAEILTTNDLAPTEDFDSSLSSIDWSNDGPSLEGWQSPSLAQKPEVSAQKEAAMPKVASSPSPELLARNPRRSLPHSAAPSAEESFLFDTGGSTFRFSDDYISKVTKSFTGSMEEMVLGKDPGVPVERKVFPQSSHDERGSLHKSNPEMDRPAAWTAAETAKMERIIREEVQMAVREVLERVAWEVIPELAENIVKKELEKVMRQMDEGQ